MSSDTDHGGAPGLDALLAQREWLSRLARSLVADPGTADDLVQRTWIRFLQSPPRSGSALRSWLRAVLRNEARQTWRAAARRTAHESIAREPAPVDPPDAVVARVEEQRRVAAAVMELEEPYRTTVLLVFYEGLAPSEIAARTGVPAETVRTRTRRALAKLRQCLDGAHGGGGAAWGLALLPLAGMTRSELVSVLAAGASPAALAGGAAVGGAKKSAAIAFVALVAGVLGTLGVQAVTAPDAGDTEIAAGRRPPAARGGTAASRDTRDGPPPRAAPPADAGPPAAAGAADPRRPEVADAAPALDAPPGEIVGRVLLADGTPLAGVTIAATRLRPPSDGVTWTEGGAAPDPAASAERIRAATQRAEREEADTLWTRTDDTGAYRFSGLPDAFHRLCASRESFRIFPVDSRGPWRTLPGRSYDFRAEALAALEADVQSGDGAAVQQARLRLVGAAFGGEVSRAWTRGGGPVWATPGTYTVTAVAGDRDELGSSAVLVTLTAGAPAAQVTLRLRPRSVLEGRVRPPDGLRLGPGTLKLRRLGAGESPDDAALAASKHREWLSPTASAAYSFPDLEPGTWHVGLSLHPDEAIVGSDVVRIGEGAVVADLRIPGPRPDRWFALRAEDEDGSPLLDPQVQVHLRTGSSSHGFPLPAMTDADGTLWLPRRTSEHDLDDCYECRIIVTSRELGTKSVLRTSRNADRVVVRFGARGRLTVTLPPGLPDELRAALRVSLVPREAGATTSGFERSEAQDGAWRSSPLEPGEYSVDVSVLDGRRRWKVHSFDVTQSAADQSVAMTLPALHRVTLHLPGRARATSVSLHRGGSREHPWPQAESGRDGAAVFRWLPAGQYEVRVSGERVAVPPVIEVRADTEFTVPAGERAR